MSKPRGVCYCGTKLRRNLYFTPADLMRVPAGGGQPEVLARVDPSKDADYQSPQLLPGGRAVLLTRRPLNITNYNDAVIFAYCLDTRERVTLVEGGSAGMYLPSGHLLYARGGSFFAMPSMQPSSRYWVLRWKSSVAAC